MQSTRETCLFADGEMMFTRQTRCSYLSAWKSGVKTAWKTRTSIFFYFNFLPMLSTATSPSVCLDTERKGRQMEEEWRALIREETGAHNLWESENGKNKRCRESVVKGWFGKAGFFKQGRGNTIQIETFLGSDQGEIDASTKLLAWWFVVLFLIYNSGQDLVVKERRNFFFSPKFWKFWMSSTIPVFWTWIVNWLLFPFQSSSRAYPYSWSPVKVNYKWATRNIVFC